MLRILIVVTSLASVLGASLGTVSESRLIGGRNTSVVQVPWQVSLVKYGYMSCAGAIVSEKFIITSAYCAQRTTPESLQVRVNSTMREEGGVLHNAKRVEKHKFYDLKKSDYDIGIIELLEPLVFGPGVQPIPLPEANEPIPDGALARITGWGWTSVIEQQLSDVLQEITVPVWNQEECIKVYEDRVTRRMMCAGGLPEGGKAACSGDSGGPVVVNGKLVGITSFSQGCGNPGIPGVFARVASMRDWWDFQTSL